MKNVTIIGGGPCGVAVGIELFLQIVNRKLQHKIKITLLEKDAEIGYGLAFRTDQPGHLLNTQADLMGIHADEPRHFAGWLKVHGGKNRKDVKGEGETEDSYTTRKLYGDYVSAQAQYYFQKARETGVQFNLLRAEAWDIQKTDGHYEVICTNGRHIASDFVVLAPGTPKPNNYPRLNGLPGYIDFPWPSHRIIEQVGKHEHVGVLGSSLSAVDAVMTLVDNGHRGKISLFAPDGLLPRVQPRETKTVHRNWLTLEAIHRIRRETLQPVGVKQVLALFQKEVEEIERKSFPWKEARREGIPAAVLLNRDITLAESGGDPILVLCEALRYDAGEIWRSWDIPEKKLFKKWLGTYWMINRHAMPLYNAYRLRTLFDEGVLEVVSHLSGVDYGHSAGKFQIQIKESEYQRVDKLINATGSASDLTQMNYRLIDNLMARGYLSAYPPGGALINERTMQAVSPEGGDGIYALGHIVNGMMLDTNAVWFNVRTAATLSKDIIARL